MHPDETSAWECPPVRELRLRTPVMSDLEALVRLDAAWSGVERRGYLRQRLSRALRPRGISLARVGESGGELVGFVLGELTLGEFGRVEATAWIDTIAVRPDHARRGVGAALIEDFVAHAYAAGAERIRTMIEPRDEALWDFLTAQGFGPAPTRVIELSLEGRP
jgi:GNAT superfamily N-acetyltransferase